MTIIAINFGIPRTNPPHNFCCPDSTSPSHFILMKQHPMKVYVEIAMACFFSFLNNLNTISPQKGPIMLCLPLIWIFMQAVQGLLKAFLCVVVILLRFIMTQAK